jgi:hypothetical protein
MQFDSQRAFPYPVLRPDIDDYTDGAFQAVVDLTYSEADAQYHVEALFALSVDEIAKAIAEGKAKYVLVLSCRDTYWRYVIETKEDTISIDFPAGVLRGEVQFFPYIVTDVELPAFNCPLINKEFGDGPFLYDKGAVLAIDEPQAYYIDKDLFKPITSVFDLVVNTNLRGAEWRLDCSGDHVRIGLSAQMKERIDAVRNNSKNRAILINSLYFAAVMQCISYLRQSDHAGRRWAVIMRQQCTNQGLDIDEESEYLIAEKLMKLPLALLETYVWEAVE